MDLFIALFSGLAGAFAVTFKKITGSIVGVAISVALMPPLCVIGIGLSTGQLYLVLGSFFLFFTNLTAIFIASTVFFLVFGFFNYFQQSSERERILSKYIISLGLLLILSLPLIFTLKEAIDKKNMQNKINAILVEKFNIYEQSKLDNWEILENKISANINTVSYIPQERIDLVDNEIKKVTGRDIDLEISQIPVFSLNQNSKKSIQSLLLNAISGQVSPQVEKEEDSNGQGAEWLKKFDLENFKKIISFY